MSAVKTFYSRQQQARRNTRLLVVYFSVAVGLIIAVLNTAAYWIITSSSSVPHMPVSEWLLSPHCWVVTAMILVVIAFGSLLRYAQLRANGGDAVAQMAGGRLVSGDTQVMLEKRLLNVAEEMAIASGTHIARVYILDNEPGINAFVAGYTPNSSILAVTRGALTMLTRDELQGVVAHEFSHVLNSDTKINLHLISILAGILMLGQLGNRMLDSTYTSRRRLDDRNSSALYWVVGLILMTVGYIGLFFGRLIKAAICRQREFLADASSVQFTRNPAGLGGALFKVANYDYGSRVDHPNTEELSHLFFSESLEIRFSSLLASHPPLKERLNAIDPSMATRLRTRFSSGQLALADGVSQFTGTVDDSYGIISEDTPKYPHPGQHLESPHNNSDAIERAEIEWTGQPLEFTTEPDTLKRAVGTLNEQHIAQAQQLHEAIPAILLTSARNLAAAESIIYGLIINTMESDQPKAITLIHAQRFANAAQQTEDIVNHLRAQPMQQRLPLFEIALSTLEQHEKRERQAIVSTALQLIALDKHYNIYEFIYATLLDKYLIQSKPTFNRSVNSYQKIENCIAVLLATVVLAGHTDPDDHEKAFALVIKPFTQKDYRALLQNPPTLQTLTAALERINKLNSLLKEPLINACVDSILYDNTINTQEADLLRAICERVDCPMPLLNADTVH